MDALRLVVFCNVFVIIKSTVDYQLSKSSSTATAGVNFSLTCTTGKEFLVFNRDDTAYCTINGATDSGACKLDPKCPEKNTYNCSTSNTYIVTFPGSFITDSLHGSMWNCANPFGIGDPSNDVEIHVYIPITRVTISAMPIKENQIEIVTGVNQEFKCTTNAGRPSSNIQWYMSGNNITDSATSQPDICNSDTKCDGYVQSSSVLLYNGSRDDEGKIIYCTAQNTESRSVRSQNITLVILYGPREVIISPATQSYTVNETSGSVGPITCMANYCKPTCTTKWRGPNITDANTAVLHLKNIHKNQTGIYNCTASNIAWNKTSVNVNVTVEYGPYQVSIFPLTQNYTVIETTGNVGPITCKADCKPYCRMTWEGPNLVGNTPILNLTNIARNQAGYYQCTAKNIAGSLKSEKVIVIVYYGPSIVTIRPSSPSIYTVIEKSDSVGPINCTADCKPNCDFTWYGPNIAAGKNAVLNFRNITRNQTGSYNCTASNLAGTKTSVSIKIIVEYGPNHVNISPSTQTYTAIETEGNIGPIICTADCKPGCTMTWSGPSLPVSTTYVLNLTNIDRNQAGYYQCNAENKAGSLKSVKVTVTVHYGPDHVILSPNEVQYTVNETSSVVPIFCTSKCQPTCTFTWRGPNLPGNTTSVLNLQEIHRKQTGDYQCTAANSVGNSTSQSVKIIVNFKPAVKDLLGKKTYNENDTVTFVCNVVSVPIASIRWFFGDTIFDNWDLVSVNTSSQNSTLEIRSAGCLSMGTYNCTAMNFIGQDTKAIDIDITCSPRINEIEYNVSTLIAVKDQEPLNITVPIIAFPKPNMYWAFVNNDSFVNVTHKTSNIVIKNRIFSNLYIENVTEADFGFYRVYAFNAIGTTEDYILSFEVFPERKPNPPKNVTCIGRPDSVLVQWISNFNGGDTQKFQIFIQMDGGGNFYNYGQTYSDPGQNRYSEAIISQLTSNKIYYLKVRASNKHNSSMSEPATCNTTFAGGDDDRSKSTNTVAIGAGTGVGGAITVLIIVAAVFVFFRRRPNCNKLGQDTEMIQRSKVKEEEHNEDELRDNPLYISSTNEDIGTVYSTVEKNRHKNKDNDKLPDESNIYTQVVKTKTPGTNKTLASKQKKTHDKGIRKEKEIGCVNENSEDTTRGTVDDVYANSEVRNKFEDKIDYKPKKNKDGLIYAELDLAPTVNGQRFVIRGLENKNNYAVIDLTKTAEPLPSDSDNEDDQTEKNI